MSKEKLPYYVKQQCLAIVRGYEATRREYQRRRHAILDAGGEHYEVYSVAVGFDNTGKIKTEERRAYLPFSHNASRTAEDIALRLEALEHTAAVKNMRAVEHAKARIGAELPDMLADMLRDGIILNCQNGRRYTFERLYVVGISRSAFYNYRDSFFRDIAEELGLF